MKRLFLHSLAISLILGSCSKKDDSQTVKEDPTDSANYQPLSKGSMWTYKIYNNASGEISNYIVTATDTVKTFGSRSYTMFNVSTGEHEYYANSGNDYYQYGGIAGINNSELLYLRKDAIAGTGWEEVKTGDIMGIGTVSFKVNYTYMGKKQNYMVEGNTYNDVRQIRLLLSDISKNGESITVTSQYINFYYAPNIGRVKSEVQLTLTPADGAPIVINTETKMKGYLIK